MIDTTYTTPHVHTTPHHTTHLCTTSDHTTGDAYSTHCALTLTADQSATFSNPSRSTVVDLLVLQGVWTLLLLLLLLLHASLFYLFYLLSLLYRFYLSFRSPFSFLCFLFLCFSLTCSACYIANFSVKCDGY